MFKHTYSAEGSCCVMIQRQKVPLVWNQEGWKRAWIMNPQTNVWCCASSKTCFQLKMVVFAGPDPFTHFGGAQSRWSACSHHSEGADRSNLGSLLQSYKAATSHCMSKNHNYHFKLHRMCHMLSAQEKQGKSVTPYYLRLHFESRPEVHELFHWWAGVHYGLSPQMWSALFF